MVVPRLQEASEHAILDYCISMHRVKLLQRANSGSEQSVLQRVTGSAITAGSA